MRVSSAALALAVASGAVQVQAAPLFGFGSLVDIIHRVEDRVESWLDKYGIDITPSTDAGKHGPTFTFDYKKFLKAVSNDRYARYIAKKKFAGWDSYKAVGVNLGTWLEIETNYTPDVLPAGYQDEWSYCAAVGKDVCGPVLEKHYESFVTRADIDRVARYGVNTLRIPTTYAAWFDVPGSNLYHGRQVEHFRNIAEYAIQKHGMHPERERFFWSDYKTKEEIKSVQALRPNEEVLSPGEGLRHIENLKRLVGSDAAAQDALHALSWSFDSSLRNHTYQLGLRDATYASTYLLQHNPRDVVFQHFVGCFVTLGQVLYQIELFMWASGGYVRSFPDPEPYLPKIRKDDCAPGTYVKVGSTTEAFGKNTIRDPFVVRSKRGISKTTSLVDPNGPDAEPLVFRRAEEDETTIEMARRLRYVGQGVGEEGMGGRGKGHLRPSFSGKDATGEPRVGTASLAFLGDPSQPVGKKRKLAAEHDVRMFAMTAIPRSRGNGFAQVVEQAGIEAAASCSSPYRLQEAVDCGMQFFACGGGGGLGTNMISSYAKGRTNDGPGMKLARFMKLLSEGLPVVLADFTDHSTGQRRRFAFPAVWESKAPHGMPRFGFLVNDLEAEGITSANPLRVWMRREGGTWTTVFGAFADDDSLGGDDVIKEWDAPHYSPEVMALACRFFAAKAIVGAAAFATEHNKEFERSASSLEALGVTTQDVDDATATVEKGLPKGGASGKRALSDRRAAADDSVRLIYGGEGSSGDIAFLRKPLMNDKGRPIAPALGFTVYKASFGGEFDREEIVAAFTSPTAVRVGLDDWELHFESSPLVIPLNNENVKIKTAAKNKITFATLETHFQAIRSGSAS